MVAVWIIGERGEDAIKKTKQYPRIWYYHSNDNKHIRKDSTQTANGDAEHCRLGSETLTPGSHMRDHFQSSSPTSVGLAFLVRLEAGFAFFDAGLVAAVLNEGFCSSAGDEKVVYNHVWYAGHTFRFLVSGSESSSSSAGTSSISSAKSSPDSSSTSCKVYEAWILNSKERRGAFFGARFLAGAFFSVTFFSAAGAFFDGAAAFFGFSSSPSSAPFTSLLSSLVF